VQAVRQLQPPVFRGQDGLLRGPGREGTRRLAGAEQGEQQYAGSNPDQGSYLRPEYSSICVAKSIG
jgi:hypothetical protein